LNDAKAEHRAFLNHYYAMSRLIYDVTRKYYLFGRDATIRELGRDLGWQRLAEIGPGTGRNLELLHRARPDATLGGIDASDAMLEHARARCPWANFDHGFAEDAPLGHLLGARPDRILFSYCLSMVRDRAAALANARGSLADGGRVVVVDFADFAGLPSSIARAFRAYLRAFHVEPLEGGTLSGATSLRFGPARYYVVAVFSPAVTRVNGR
jgi:S-adenosylmethionine-diacylgycerolhomoserine-N-methlytransferase